MILVLLAAVVGLTAGVFVNRLVARRRTGEAQDMETFKIGDLVGVVSTLTVLLLAFVLVQTFSSWKDARTAATNEASSSISLARHSHFVKEEGGAPIVRSLVCYVRSVRELEWPAMDDRKSSTTAEHWLDSIRIQIELLDDDSVAPDLINLERELDERREARLDESLPSVPSTMFHLLIFGVGLTLFVQALLTNVDIRSTLRLLGLGSSTIMLVAFLSLIHEIDKPYSGPTAIHPTAMRVAERELREELALYTTRAKPECTRRGIPNDDASFTPGRESVD